jgi:hypothetical protein
MDGDVSYLRWKESMLLLLNTAGVAHVLSEDPPPSSGDGAAASRKWSRDDAVCRGHILAALSDAIFPDYVRHGTGRELWRAVSRTYDVGTPPSRLVAEVHRVRVQARRRRSPVVVPEQLAHAEALGLAGQAGSRRTTVTSWTTRWARSSRRTWRVAPRWP